MTREQAHYRFPERYGKDARAVRCLDCREREYVTGKTHFCPILSDEVDLGATCDHATRAR